MDNAKKRTGFRIGDLAAILLVALLTVGLVIALFAAEKGRAVEISVDGAVVATLSLEKDTVYPVEAGGHRLTVHIENGEVFVTDASCPDKVCENTGRVSAKGTSIVCAAAGVSVRVLGGGDGNADFVAG